MLLQISYRYIDIVRSEGLEISQPALDPTKSVVHHPLTARQKNIGVHRRFYKFKGSGRCDQNSKAPPCIGWVEMMAPVFSKAAWRCVWYMIQNDLIHAWGLDRQLGYCAQVPPSSSNNSYFLFIVPSTNTLFDVQGDRTKNVGIVDSEYIIHLGLPTLGVLDRNKAIAYILFLANNKILKGLKQHLC
ncbi:hypothetical protein Cgig2_007968 [Carnegiea gigantea]|uniref:Uncharacterized protein n=1 Tax=Carnegiea gigantea TaxID=171969 RepID=A0A9Q1GJL2_9CARY|nr:hypothetical protein Cgig2_007968 [Carnegiea gigantea]